MTFPVAQISKMRRQEQGSSWACIRTLYYRPQTYFCIGWSKTIPNHSPFFFSDRFAWLTICLSRATSVPVGEDQSQHLEFARDLANTFNFTFKQPVFAEPNGLICQALYPFPLFLANASLALAPAKRIMSLKDPTQKMSKSSPNTASRILINDDADVIRDKIAKSLTDSHTQSITYDPLSRPGIANLIDILRHTTKTQTPPEDIAAHFNNVQGVKVKALKGAVADAVVRELAPVRERYDALIAKDAQGHSHALSEPLLIGREKAKKSAMKTMKLVRQAVDLPCYN